MSPVGRNTHISVSSTVPDTRMEEIQKDEENIAYRHEYISHLEDKKFLGNTP
jgi:hypothetical protein